MAETARGGPIEIGKEVWQEIGDDDLLGMAGEVAYNLLLALFPALIFIAALAGFVGQAVGVQDLFDRILANLAQVLPPSALETITTPLAQILSTQSGGLLSIGILGTIWAASSATATMMKAFNRAYGVKETRPFWLYRLLIAVGLTLLLAVLLLGAVLLFIFGEQLGRWVAGFIGAGEQFVTIWTILRWPIIVVALLLGLALLYWLGPNVRQSFRWISPGSLAATLLWLLFTFLFQLYIANFNNYDNTYGTIAGIIILLLWLNYSAFVFLVGAELNQVLQKRYDPHVIEHLVENPEKLTAAARQEPLGAARRQATAEELRDPDATPPAAETARAQRAGEGSDAHVTRIVEPAPQPGRLTIAALGLWTLLVFAGAVLRGKDKRRRA